MNRKLGIRSSAIGIFYVFLVLGLVITVYTSGENNICVSFDNDPFNPKNEWINMGPDSWAWSNAAYPPDITNIPSFHWESGYVWFQDQMSPPQYATMQMEPPQLLDRGDVITATIYRHIIEENKNDTHRPVLSFFTENVTMNLIYSRSYELWDTVSETCGYSIECCSNYSYPCSGHFQLNGEVMVRDELLAVDRIEVNAACGYWPSPFCCNFDANLCSWSLSPGWMWSNNKTVPPLAPPPLHTNYVWATLSEPQTSATLSTPVISGVEFNSTFTFRYYLFTNGKDSSLVFLFDKLHVYTISTSHLDWQTITVGCKQACESGTLKVEIICENATGDTVCAIDGFTINNTCAVDT